MGERRGMEAVGEGPGVPPAGGGAGRRRGVERGRGAGREVVCRQALGVDAHHRAGRLGDVGQAIGGGIGNLVGEVGVEVHQRHPRIGADAGLQLGVEGADPLANGALQRGRRRGAGGAAAVGLGDAAEHRLEARSQRDVGRVQHRHVGRALVQRAGLDRVVVGVCHLLHVQASRQRAAIGLAERGGQGRAVDLLGQEGLVGRQPRAAAGCAEIGPDQVGRVIAAAVDQDQVGRAPAAADHAGGRRQLQRHRLRPRRAALAGRVHHAAAADGEVGAARRAVRNERGAGELEEVALAVDAEVLRDDLRKDRKAGRRVGSVLHRELEAEGAGVREAVAGHEHARNGDLGTGGVSATAAAGQQGGRGAGCCQQRPVEFHGMHAVPR
jgi:hypothetical protein